MYRCQLNFAIFAATSALGISWQHLNHPNLLVQAVYRFHVYFHVQLILHKLHISLPHEDGFSNVKNDYESSAYYSVCNEYGVDLTETWMYGDWFCTTDYAIFGHNVKATERSPPDNVTRWIITQYKGFTKGIEKISRPVMAYVYLVLSSQVKARSTTVGNSAPAVDAQKVFKGTFKSLINGDFISRSVRACIINSRFFNRGRYIYASQQFKLSHWKKGRIQQQNFSEQHRHENWLKQGHKQGS